ncbi:MAG: hypothetical protein HY287_13950 [Planctomycetes bacterium]|nr:hypothetical protein [Planctomycetota bacterium]MBI3835425.1 hypothetical protein [Planctomycetota bacterium]
MTEGYAGSDRRAIQPERRETIVDRRSGLDLEKSPGHWRPDSRKCAEDNTLDGEMFEFIAAIDEYRTINKKPFLSWSEVFEIIQYLGYRRVAIATNSICTAGSAERMGEVTYSGPERRKQDSDRRKSVAERRTGMDRRKGPGRRRGEVRKSAEEGEMGGELWEFITAIDDYRRINERPYPKWSEIFDFINCLGYRRVAAKAQHINTASSPDVLDEFTAPVESLT